jgi:lipid A 3-O-deacylase
MILDRAALGGIIAWAVAFMVAICPGLAAAAPPECLEDAEKTGTLSIVVENDLFAKTDRHYTAGQGLSWVTSPSTTPAWAGKLASDIPAFRDSKCVRAQYDLNQAIFTPSATMLSNPDPSDRPYGGWLNASVSLIGISGDDSRRLDQLTIGVGTVGPASLAQQAQRLVHTLEGIPIPAGWAFQLRNEPTLQLQYERSSRAFAYPSRKSLGLAFDVIPHAGFALGNVYTYADIGATMRVGVDLPQDYGPPRLGPSVPASTFFETDTRVGWYLFAGVEGRAVARNLFLDGNTLEDSRRVTKIPVVADVQAGLAITVYAVRLSYTQIWRSREFVGQSSPDQFGVVTLSVRW